MNRLPTYLIYTSAHYIFFPFMTINNMQVQQNALQRHTNLPYLLRLKFPSSNSLKMTLTNLGTINHTTLLIILRLKGRTKKTKINYYLKERRTAMIILIQKGYSPQHLGEKSKFINKFCY